MSNLSARIQGASVTYHPHRLESSLVLSGGSISELTEVRAAVRVSVNGREAVGVGSVYLSILWAWPSPEVAHESKELALRALCDDVAAHIRQYTGNDPEHPLELGLRLHEALHAGHENGHAAVPALAKAMCASPFDAAIHDGVGQAVGRSAFQFYDSPVPLPSADALFAGGGACAAIRRTLLPRARRELPAWLIVGKDDVLGEDVRPWAVERRYHCFKLKLMGRDNREDVARTVDVYRSARRWGITRPLLSVDTNEGNPDAASVLDYLNRLRGLDREVFDALLLLEQPTGRDIRQRRYDWRDVAKLKPVLLDEGLTDFDLLPEALAQGWSGLALKTCKGHSFTLVAAAWAREHGMLLSLQDLTNPGFALIHAALLAAHLPTINGVELNSPQFTPAANRPWSPRLAELFEPVDGAHRAPRTCPPGLGSIL